MIESNRMRDNEKCVKTYLLDQVHLLLLDNLKNIRSMNEELLLLFNYSPCAPGKPAEPGSPGRPPSPRSPFKPSRPAENQMTFISFNHTIKKDTYVGQGHQVNHQNHDHLSVLVIQGYPKWMKREFESDEYK